MHKLREISVVAGVLIKDGKFFLQQRSSNRTYPLAWECPGGKMEAYDIGPIHALNRELEEELGWRYDQDLVDFPGRIDSNPLYTTVFEPVGRGASLRLTFFKIDVHPEWKPCLRDAEGCGWFSHFEMSLLKLTPGNLRLLEAVQSSSEIKYRILSSLGSK